MPVPICGCGGFSGSAARAGSVGRPTRDRRDRRAATQRSAEVGPSRYLTPFLAPHRALPGVVRGRGGAGR